MEKRVKSEKRMERHKAARELILKNQKENEKVGISNYSKNMRAHEARQEEKKRKERHWCEQEYDSYKKKYETSVCNYSILMEQIKKENRETDQQLQCLDHRLALGWDRSVIMQEDKKRRAQANTEKISKVIEDHH